MPLDYLLQAAQEDEGKRLAREQILPADPESGAGAPPPAATANSEPLTPLQELGATSQQALTHLIEQTPDMFNQLNPQTIASVSLHPNYALPPAAARELRGLNPARWQAAFDQRLRELLVDFEERTEAAALDNAWGLNALRDDGLPRNLADGRFLPTIARRMRARLIALISAEPAGLAQARRQLHQWLYELELERRALTDEENESSAPAGAGRAERQMDLRDWRARYLRTLADQPSLFGSMTRALGLLGGVVLLTIFYLFGSGLAGQMDVIVARDANPVALMGVMNEAFAGAVVDFVESEANAATLIGAMIGAFLGAMISYRTRARRVRALRRERVNLARAELSDRLQESVRLGLAASISICRSCCNRWIAFSKRPAICCASGRSATPCRLSRRTARSVPISIAPISIQPCGRIARRSYAAAATPKAAAATPACATSGARRGCASS